MKRIYLLFFIMFLLAGCLNDSAAEQELDYDQTKKMVIDILHTDEGEKALQEIIAKDKMKQHLIMDSDVVKESITDTLGSKASVDMWKDLFEEPSFVESYQKSMADEQKKLFKSLMNDASFQKQMLNLLENPEMRKQTLTVLKGQQFREHLEDTIQETIEAPLFQAKVQELLLKAAEEKRQEEKDKEKENKDEEGNDGSNEEDNAS